MTNSNLPPVPLQAAKWGAIALLIYAASFLAALLATKLMSWVGAATIGGAS